jgi:hypothetical protein
MRTFAVGTEMNVQMLNKEICRSSTESCRGVHGGIRRSSSADADGSAKMPTSRQALWVVE